MKSEGPGPGLLEGAVEFDDGIELEFIVDGFDISWNDDDC